MVVIAPPIFKDHATFAQGVKQFPVQAFGSEASVEAFGVAVLPGAALIARSA